MKLFSLIILLLFSTALAAQDVNFFRVQFGLNSPNQPFSNISGNNSGAADHGISTGAELVALWQSGVGLSIKGGFATNGVKYDAFENEINEHTSSSLSVSGNNYTYGYFLPGLLYRNENENIYLDLCFNAGMISSNMPDMYVMEEGNDNSEKEVFDSTEQIVMGYNPGITLGYKVSFGSIFVSGSYMFFKSTYLSGINDIINVPTKLTMKHSNIEILLGASFKFQNN